MKKISNTRIATILKNIFNIRWWIDYDRLKTYTAYLGNGFKKMFVPQQAEQNESFETAVKEYNLTEKELFSKQRALYRLSILMALVALFMLGYAGYHVFYGSIRATIISVVVMLIALVLAFRYHFWYFQIKQRQLGCSFRQWYKQGLLGEKNE